MGVTSRCHCVGQQWVLVTSSNAKGLPTEAPDPLATDLLGRRRPVVALAPLHLLQHHAVEQHGQLGGANLQPRRTVAADGGKMENALFESLIKNGPAVLLPGQNL